MRVIVNVYVRSKTDARYASYSGRCVVDLFELPDNLLNDNYFLMRREIERKAIDKFLIHVASNGWVALREDPLDIEEEAVLVNLEGCEAIDVDISEILSEKGYEQAQLKRLEYAIKNSADIVDNKE